MSKLFIIYIFTASIKEYANPLLNEIDKNNVISKRFYRDSCTKNNIGKYVKNLNKLNYNLKDVILLDNSPISYSFNKTNGLPIKSWHYDKNDKELLKIGSFLQFLSSVDDVRYYISKVVENDEISYYKINLMINKKINSNNKAEDNYWKKEEKIEKKSRIYTNNFNKSVNNVTPYKRINFNNDENIYLNLYTKTDVNNNNNISAINFREPNLNNRNSVSRNKKIDYLSCHKIIQINKHNNKIKININSINFNLEQSKSLKKDKKNHKKRYIISENN